MLDYEGAPVFAEIFILRLLKANGWNGVWVSSYGGFKFLSDMPIEFSMTGAIVNIPLEKERLLQEIRQRSACRGGCFDVFVWREQEVMFCEAKRLAYDRLRDTQRTWIEAALSIGVPLRSLRIVEWNTKP